MMYNEENLHRIVNRFKFLKKKKKKDIQGLTFTVNQKKTTTFNLNEVCDISPCVLFP